jgi:hypothetical protein
MPKVDKSKKECRFCSLLGSSLWQGQEYFRCQAGRFDDNYGSRSFVWQGIWRANKKVAAVQKDCPCFQVHPKVENINRSGRP